MYRTSNFKVLIMFLPTLTEGTRFDCSIPDLMTRILYPGVIKMKINKHATPITMETEFLKISIPTGKINSNTNNRQTNPNLFKSLKGYLNEFEMIPPKFTKLPMKYCFVFK